MDLRLNATIYTFLLFSPVTSSLFHFCYFFSSAVLLYMFRFRFLRFCFAMLSYYFKSLLCVHFVCLVCVCVCVSRSLSDVVCLSHLLFLIYFCTCEEIVCPRYWFVSVNVCFRVYGVRVVACIWVRIIAFFLFFFFVFFPSSFFIFVLVYDSDWFHSCFSFLVGVLSTFHKNF